MTKLDSYFIRYTDKLAYIDLKDDKTYSKLKGLPLPIYLDDMKDGIKSGDFGNEINIEILLEGMLINIAIDPDFKFKDKYIKIIESYIKNIGDYTGAKAMKIESEDKIKATLLARAGYIIDEKNNYNSYIYARLLWPMAYDEDSDFRDSFVRSALEILQKTLSYDENFAISYYELGNIYANLGEYIKARSYYKNALAKTDDDYAKEEIRNNISQINDNAEIEEALYFIGKSNYQEAVTILTKLLGQVKRADAYYYLGVAYQNLTQYQNSIMAFENSLDLGADFREIYNDYAVSLYLDKSELEAIDILNKGLKKYPQDPRMTYNKIQINLVIGNTSQAKSDIEELLTYDDLSEEIKENLLILQKQYEIN